MRPFSRISLQITRLISVELLLADGLQAATPNATLNGVDKLRLAGAWTSF